jgi:glycosyltransferase involved in cell wall biosynthesis
VIDVAIDARVTRRMSMGTRAYLQELLARLPTVAPELRVRPLGHGENFGFAEQVALPRAIARSRARMVHYPTTFAPVVRTAPYVVTIHDLIHLRYPAFFGPATTVHYALVGKPLARGARLLCMGDERTAEDCERFLGVARERCRVVPLGYDPMLLEREQALTVERPFLFYAGNHRRHKDLTTLLAAWAALAPSVELDLRLTGPDEPSLRARFSRKNGTLSFTGDLTPLALRAHYRAALAYVHPALCEGFGIPMLEAAVVGTPVIASEGAISRIVAPYAATFANGDPDALTSLLHDLARAPAAWRMRAAEGVAPLRAYTWDRFAASTAAVYHEVLDGL